MLMDTKTYNLKVMFITGPLGTQPQKDVATEYITSKVADSNGDLPEDELATLPEELERGTTAFHKLEGAPIFYDYQVKGFIKDAGQVFNGLRNVRNLRSKLDNLCFVEPRQIKLNLPEGEEITFCERPLRAQTAQGPRVSLARSEQLPDGTWFECKLVVFDGPISESLRNGGRGRFMFELEAVE
jgi:hypothetical protein